MRLTTGFWLADTACTQALWMAVMGRKNPSRFQEDARNPVEKVSWDEVGGFLRRLASLVPGIVAELPTEAEWEYACRAGSETPFHFGATITPEQANYEGNYPYAGGSKGKNRKTTVPVKSFPPNDWGLYEMHGNVWEWCADGMRTYDGTEQEYPRGPEGLAARAARRLLVQPRQVRPLCVPRCQRARLRLPKRRFPLCPEAHPLGAGGRRSAPA